MNIHRSAYSLAVFKLRTSRSELRCAAAQLNRGFDVLCTGCTGGVVTEPARKMTAAGGAE